MAETTEFVSRIKVRELISAYESKSEQARVQFTRPRAKSIGDLLAKHVVVRLNEFETLEDVERALRQIEININFYEVYNKAKHVSFQEELFNILTCIANIESEAEDAAYDRKRLITKTQTLVSFLNQKLPSNNVVAPAGEQPAKYKTYASYVQERNKANVSSSGSPKHDHGHYSENIKANPILNTSNGESRKINQAPYSENTKPVDVVDTGYTVSVRKLKETFVSSSPSTPAQEKIRKPQDKVENKTTQNDMNESPLEKPKEKEDKNVPVSVTNLRNVFENKCKETPKGLNIISIDKNQLRKPVFGGSASNINIPYTDRNLGTFRLQRTISGNYMNYSGLLNSVDISRSKSINDIDNTNSYESNNRDLDESYDSDDEDSGAETESTIESTEGSVESVKVIEICPPGGPIEGADVKSIREKFENLKEIEEVDVKYSTATDSPQIGVLKEESAKVDGIDEIDTQYSSATPESPKLKQIKEHFANVSGVEEIEVRYATASSETPKVEDIKKNFETVNEIEVIYSTSNVDDQKHQSGHENTSSAVGIDEVEIKYSTATAKEIQNVKDNESFADVSGVDEIEVKYTTATTQEVPGNENVANVSGSDKTEAQGKKDNESLANVREADEAELKYSTATVQELKDSESFANVNGVEEIEIRYFAASGDDAKQSETEISNTNETDEEEIYYSTESIPSKDDEKKAIVNGIEEIQVNYSTTNSVSSEVTKDSINRNEDEVDKLVEETLKDVVDLKKAEDEFEKLVQSSDKEALKS